MLGGDDYCGDYSSTVVECTCSMWHTVRDFRLHVRQLLTKKVGRWKQTKLLKSLHKCCPCCLWYLNILYYFGLSAEDDPGWFHIKDLDHLFIRTIECCTFVVPSDVGDGGFFDQMLTRQTTDVLANFVRSITDRMELYYQD
jgi:hypothetical protein